MMRLWLNILWYLLLLVPSFVYAADNIPSALIYNNQPIDPLCFDMTASENDIISLEQCGLKIGGKKIKSKDIELLKKGYIGFDYVETPQKNVSDQTHGYSYYKAFANTADSSYVYAVNNGGGSGTFTTLMLVKRDGNQLKTNTLAGGDRCNGGIVMDSVKRENQHLTYAVNLTPYDFLELSQNNPHHLRAYDDLQACAACCVATALYQVDIGKDTSEARFISVDLGTDNAESDASGYQLCFDNLLSSYKNRGKRFLSALELQQLMQRFNDECIES